MESEKGGDIMNANFSALTQPPSGAGQYAETQFEIIKKYILEFQASLDQEHDVGVLLASFGTPVLMQVTHIGFHRPVLIIFKGFVGENPTTLIQHISQLSFLLQAVPKPSDKPHRDIGFIADWGDKPSINQMT